MRLYFYTFKVPKNKRKSDKALFADMLSDSHFFKAVIQNAGIRLELGLIVGIQISIYHTFNLDNYNYNL